MIPRLSIRSRLLLSILLILLVSYATLVFTTIKNVNASLEEKIDKDLEENLRYVKSQYLARAELVQYSLQQILAEPSVQLQIRQNDINWLKDALARWHKLLPFIDLLNVLTPENIVIARVSSAKKGDSFAMPGVIESALKSKVPVITTELVPSSMLLDEGELGHQLSLPADGQAMMVTIVIPVYSDAGELLGVVVAGDVINRDPHLPFRIQEIFGKEVEVMITQRGYRIASSVAEEMPVFSTLSEDIQARLNTGKSYRGEADFGGKIYETTFAPIINGSGEVIGSLSVALSKEDFNRIRRHNLRNIFASAVIGIFLSFAIAFVAARRLTRPLLKLARGAQNIEAGDLNQQVKVDQEDEVGMLANSFNRMASALAERDRIITKKNEDLQDLNDSLERKVAARTAELSIEMERLEAILTSMAEGVVVTNRDNRVVLFNPAAQKIFDLMPHRLIGQSLSDAEDLGSFSPVVELLTRGEVGGEILLGREEELFVRGKKLRCNISPLLDADGAFAGVVMSIRDVTMEEAVDRMKTEFISTVSHELKTPLTSMKGALQFIISKSEHLSQTDRDLLSVCLRNTDRLIRLVNDILDISKIEAGRLELNCQPLAIHPLIASALEEIKGFALNKNIAIKNEAKEELPKIYGDQDRLLQVLSNLLSNAVKFSPVDEEIQIFTQREGNYIIISVADKGREIEWSDRDKLFKKFQQLDSEQNGGRDGTGLGLAICKEIIERHHGRIYYQTGTNGGNIFAFTVPVCEEQP